MLLSVLIRLRINDLQINPGINGKRGSDKQAMRAHKRKARAAFVYATRAFNQDTYATASPSLRHCGE